MRSASMVLGVIALLAALGWWRTRSDTKSEEAAHVIAPSPHDEEREQAAELNALRARVTRLEQQLNALQKVAGSAPPSSPAPTTHLASAALVDTPAPTPDFVATFDRDARPAQHTPRAAELQARMKAHLPPDASLDRLECRGEICRVELTMPGINRYHDFIKSAFGNPDTRVWSGATKFGYLTEPDAQNWEHDEISVYAYLGPRTASAER